VVSFRQKRTSDSQHTNKKAEGYKVKLDGNFQYGQKNAEGELRFVVYHDQERKPYQVSRREDAKTGSERILIKRLASVHRDSNRVGRCGQSKQASDTVWIWRNSRCSFRASKELRRRLPPHLLGRTFIDRTKHKTVR
jgi:hypothetical protein